MFDIDQSFFDSTTYQFYTNPTRTSDTRSVSDRARFFTKTRLDPAPTHFRLKPRWVDFAVSAQISLLNNGLSMVLPYQNGRSRSFGQKMMRLTEFSEKPSTSKVYPKSLDKCGKPNPTQQDKYPHPTRPGHQKWSLLDAVWIPGLGRIISGECSLQQCTVIHCSFAVLDSVH